MNTEINVIPEELKILSIGNSFSIDTMEYAAAMALSMGVKRVRLGNLYIGGCSVKRHYTNAKEDLPAYKYYTNDGSGWKSVTDCKISDAVKSEKWDWISIQHGTGDGSRYTSEESYSDLPLLIEYVRGLADAETKIAFNMAWVGEAYKDHHEINSYNGDMGLMYRNLVDLTSSLIAPMKGIDTVIPTGTAVQNARVMCPDRDLTRDGFHLSWDFGRYIGGMTFLKRLLKCDLNRIVWTPDGVDGQLREVAIDAANKAVGNPFKVT